MYVTLNENYRYSKLYYILDLFLMYSTTIFFVFILHFANVDETSVGCKFGTLTLQFLPLPILFYSLGEKRNELQNLSKFYGYLFSLLLFIQSISMLLFFVYIYTPIGMNNPRECTPQLYVIRLVNGFISGSIGYLIYASRKLGI